MANENATGGDKPGANTDDAGAGKDANNAGGNNSQNEGKTATDAGKNPGGNKSFKPIETPEELDKIVSKRARKMMRAESRKSAADNSDADDDDDDSDASANGKKDKSQKSEREKQLEKDNRVLRASGDLKDELMDAGCSAKQAAKIVRMYADEMEIDRKGKITNLDDILDDAKDDFPEFFKTEVKGSGDGGAGGGSGSGGDNAAADMNTILRRGFGRKG